MIVRLKPKLLTVLILALSVMVGAQSAKPSFEAVQPDLLAAGALRQCLGGLRQRRRPRSLRRVQRYAQPALSQRWRHARRTCREAGVADARATRAAAWGDYDADGDADLLVGFAPGRIGATPLSQRRRRFADVTRRSWLAVDSGAVRQPAGWTSMAMATSICSSRFAIARTRCLRNDNGKFTDVAAEVGLADTRKSVGAVWFDYDEDGDLDLYVAQHGRRCERLVPQQRRRFTDVAEKRRRVGRSHAVGDATNGTVRPCAADVNGDGRIDLFIANYGRNGLFLNSGAGKFVDASDAWGIAIDVALRHVRTRGLRQRRPHRPVRERHGHGWRQLPRLPVPKHRDEVRRSDTGERADAAGRPWRAVGRLRPRWRRRPRADGHAPDGMHSLLRNVLPAASARQALQVRVVDGRGRATLAGAEVRIYQPGTRTLLGARLVDTGSGYDAQNEMPVHFGVAGHSRVDVEVIYPTGKARKPVRRTGVRIAGDRFEVLTIQVGR